MQRQQTEEHVPLGKKCQGLSRRYSPSLCIKTGRLSRTNLFRSAGNYLFYLMKLQSNGSCHFPTIRFGEDVERNGLQGKSQKAVKAPHQLYFLLVFHHPQIRPLPIVFHPQKKSIRIFSLFQGTRQKNVECLLLFDTLEQKSDIVENVSLTIFQICRGNCNTKTTSRKTNSSHIEKG